MTTSKRMAIAAAILGLMLAGASSARAGKVLKIEGRSITVPAGGYLSCKIMVNSARVADATVTLLDATGAPVPTEFGYSYRVSPIASGTGLYYLETSAGAFGDPQSGMSGSCRAGVEGFRGLDGSLEASAYDGNGNMVGTSTSHFSW